MVEALASRGTDQAFAKRHPLCETPTGVCSTRRFMDLNASSMRPRTNPSWCPHKRLCSHHGEQRSPVDQPREQSEDEASGIVEPPRLDLRLDIERQLLAQEQFLSGEASVG